MVSEYGFPSFLAKSQVMQKIVDLIRRVAGSLG